MATDFLIGGLAGVGAGFFSNPFDVVKTRMQLQGELKSKGKHVVHYKNIPHAIFTIVKYDGWSALQKGLVPALYFQLVVNGVRLGIYQQADNYGFLRDEENNTKFVNSVLVGGVAGIVGGFSGSPLQMVKTQLMSYSSEKIAVGTQHKHMGFFYALSKIYKANGLGGLWRGSHGMMMRNGIGSASQIATFSCIKEWLNNTGLTEGYVTTLIASNFAAIVKTITMTPLDVVVTRLYNQAVDEKGNGMLYRGIYDCAKKISKTEGILAFYKGMGACYFRQAPHSILLLLFWDLLKDLQKTIETKL